MDKDKTTKTKEQIEAEELVDRLEKNGFFWLCGCSVEEQRQYEDGLKKD